MAWVHTQTLGTWLHFQVDLETNINSKTINFLKIITSIYSKRHAWTLRPSLRCCPPLSTILERWGTTCPTSQDDMVQTGVLMMRLSYVLNKINRIRFVIEHIWKDLCDGLKKDRIFTSKTSIYIFLHLNFDLET